MVASYRRPPLNPNRVIPSLSIANSRVDAMNKNTTTESTTRGRIWLTTWIGLAAFFAIIAFSKPGGDGSSSNVDAASVSLRQPASKLKQGNVVRAIEEIRVGDRVHVDISDYQRELAVGRIGGRGWDSSDVAIDPDRWGVVQLSMESEDGDRFDISLLRPTEWFEASGAALGKQIQLSIPEQGLDGPATVLAIDECPPLAGGQGRIVTGTFTHIRGGILRINVEGVADAIGVTRNHPVYSVNAGDFVYASELSVGDHVQLLERQARIERVDEVQGEQRVFNLEVRGDHVYHVTGDGILVHNASQHGSYTVTFSDGSVYHGKGPKTRSQISAKREVKAHNNDPANANNQISHTASDWKPASSSREAFKAEARRIDADSGGVGSAANRNRINSPGRKYIHQDGGTTVH